MPGIFLLSGDLGETLLPIPIDHRYSPGGDGQDPAIDLKQKYLMEFSIRFRPLKTQDAAFINELRNVEAMERMVGGLLPPGFL